MGTTRIVTKKLIADRVAKGESLARADLRGLDLSGISFDRADLTAAKLGGCNLARSTFRGANLFMASLWQTDCKDAVFDGANLEEADLDLANLEGATFRDAVVRKTIFPQGRVEPEEIRRSVRSGTRVKMVRTKA